MGISIWLRFSYQYLRRASILTILVVDSELLLALMPGTSH